MRALVLAGLAAVVLVAAGCGGEEAPPEPPEAEPAPAPSYVETLRQAFDPVLEATGGLADVSELEELEAGLEELEDAANEGVERLRAAEPPEELAGAHNRLVSGFEVLAGRAAEARAAFAAAREGDLAELPALLEAGSALGLEGIEVIQDALEELRELGVDTDRIGGG